ncbi:MAG TPA: sigma factor-like helix-turn-helix DNA-binding protein [Candidatus Moranbacteria bacterium]|nr:sigma factor-like helix-turn-helix DNA-binding protein [Candidatus Moranbacteria bacterium]
MKKSHIQGETLIKTAEKELQGLRFFDLVMEMMNSLSPRSQEIIQKRHGLSEEKGKTLEKIGKEYGITRERVRQIISDAVEVISSKKENENFRKAEERLIFTIEKNNGIIKETDIVQKFNIDGAKEANSIRFFAGCSEKIQVIGEKGNIEKSWVLSNDALIFARKIGEEAKNILNKEKKLLSDNEISKKIKEKISDLDDIVEDKILSFLHSLSAVKKNKFGKWGIISWPEVNPKGTREKIFLILKEMGKPLHFTEIAALIDEHKLGKRKAHPQTVHNELIKDNRFVLIGRGIYALKEWGYTQGTIKDVLKEILEKSKKPLSREEIMAEVLKMRKVKKTTIMINLNNAKNFQRQNNFYTVKK